MSKACESFLNKCEEFWKNADRDGDGTLTVGELHEMFMKLGVKNMTDQQCAEIFYDLDTDSDRKISRDEFRTAMMKKDPKQIQRVELEDTFKKLDKDKSGRLSKEEVKQAFSLQGIKISDERLNAIMKESDTDGDGSINLEEFLKEWSKGC